jgi:hypothetical protein
MEDLEMLVAIWTIALLVQMGSGYVALHQIDAKEEPTPLPVQVASSIGLVPFGSFLLFVIGVREYFMSSGKIPVLLVPIELLVFLVPINFVAAFASVVTVSWSPHGPFVSLFFRASCVAAGVIAFYTYLAFVAWYHWAAC